MRVGCSKQKLLRKLDQGVSSVMVADGGTMLSWLTRDATQFGGLKFPPSFAYCMVRCTIKVLERGIMYHPPWLDYSSLVDTHGIGPAVQILSTMAEFKAAQCASYHCCEFLAALMNFWQPKASDQRFVVVCRPLALDYSFLRSAVLAW